MIKIDQALFGYSNGHHMLASSRQLSYSAQKILEPMSDLSGPEMKEGFSEYVTGYPLAQDNCYALSKTWYASEMKRPGCVWTHTFFIKFDDLEALSKSKPIWEYFSRPAMSNEVDVSAYSNPLCIETPAVGELDVLYTLINSKTAYFLKPIFENNDPIYISAEGSEKYNLDMCFLWSRLVPSYWRNFSFCTGSLSNRSIERKALDVQIVPISIAKNLSRTVRNSRLISDSDETKEVPVWLSIIMDELVLQKKHEFKEFISNFSDKYFHREYAKCFATLYSKIIALDGDIVNLFNSISEMFSKKDCPDIRKRLLTMLLVPENNISVFGQVDSAMALEKLSTDYKYDDSDIDDQFLTGILRKTWESNSVVLHTTFSYWIHHDLNEFGERLVGVFATILKPSQLPIIMNSESRGSHILVSFNHKLALCEDLWMQSRNFQMEILNCLKGCEDNNLISEIIMVIYTTSTEDISEQVYKVFGRAAIENYFMWAAKHEDAESIQRWAKICSFDSSICIKELPNVQSIYILQSIIQALDPYASIVYCGNKQLWIAIYHRFCQNRSGQIMEKVFAPFILPIIMQSNEKYPDDIAFFAFNEVHKMLAEDQMRYDEWRKLDVLLPPVSWYNSWDKCKRIRKAAKKLKYEFELK